MADDPARDAQTRMWSMQQQGLAVTARTALLEAMAETNVATDGTCELPAAYLLMTATR